MEKGVKPSRIVIGGFSQGGAISLFTGITNKEKLGGVFGLSCYLLLSDRIKNLIPEEWPNKKTPFFLAHGTDDSVVQYAFGSLSSKAIKDLGVEDVDFHSYRCVFFLFPLAPLLIFSWSGSSNDSSTSGLDHGADPEEIGDLEHFLEKTIPPEEEGGPSAGL